ncbi:MAG: sulfatase [Candidatus Sabulitectum sp.]|nr:sulfatase [Candidatus Sabulitectum sp.]
MKSFVLCYLLVLILLTLSSCANDQKVNVVLIIIDTLNADHLGCYDYCRDTSPAIDSLAASGILFRNCQAQAPWTLPGMASIFTGLTERSHRCSHYDGFSHGLDPEMPTLTTILKEQGYSTAALVNVGYLGEPFGITKGNDYFWYNDDGSDNADITVNALLEYFSSNEVPKPFFTVIHLFDPHLPYDPPSPFNTLFKHSGTNGITEWPEIELCFDPVLIEHMTAMYDSEIRWTDSQLSKLFSGMREMGLADNTLFILIADHGEEFMQHGDWGHAHNLYQQALHIPLILTGPGIEPGTVVSENVGQYDVLPTVLKYLEMAVPDHVEGINILGEIPETRVIPSSGVIADTASAACLQGSKKVLWFVEPDSSETFNLEDDPGEMNLLPVDSLLLEEVMNYWAWPCICTPTENEEAIIEMRRLEGLGYIR